ncbi:MAG: hypothetical protein GX605_08335 [Chloroflexi bacterium]|nr:hypothetical protein [Chloroflexota bacterium]
MNDGTAFANLCAAGGWDGRAFIGRDDPERPPQTHQEGTLFLGNRWSALGDFLALVAARGFPLDEGVALVIDLDKTAIGARGRNDGLIDAARLEGLRRTVSGLLGVGFDEAAFRQAYDELNQPLYHPFTADNQDYLAYLCLMLGAGLCQLAPLLGRIRDGSLATFSALIEEVQRRRGELAGSGLAAIHDQVWGAMQAADPTPFKAFRRQEYLATIARCGDLPGASAPEALAARIVVTEEVRQAARKLKEGGALVFAVSDKPDEASHPSAEDAQLGLQPLHRQAFLSVGEA